GSSDYRATPFSSYYSQNSYNEHLTEIIVNGAVSLYEKMIKGFTNEAMTNVISCTYSNLIPAKNRRVFVISHIFGLIDCFIVNSAICS
ncbi:MAG: hypothetical protein WAM27_07380, partial [Nitrososphaeraceae archaeon]